MNKVMIFLLTIAYMGFATPVEGQYGQLVSYGTDNEFGCTSYFNPDDPNYTHTASYEFAINTYDPSPGSGPAVAGLAALNIGLIIFWDGSTDGLDLTNVPATTPGGSTDVGSRIMSSCSASFVVTNPDLLPGSFLATPVEIGENYVHTGIVFVHDIAALTAIPYNSSCNDSIGFNQIEQLGTVNITFPQGLFFNYLQYTPNPSSPGIRLYRNSAPGSIGQDLPEWTIGQGASFDMDSDMFSVQESQLCHSPVNYEMFHGFDAGNSATLRDSLEIKFRTRSSFNRGTFDNDGASSLSDVMSILFYLFQGVGTPVCEKAIDVNDDGILDLTDAIGLLEYLYGSGAAVPFPGPTDACSPDPTPDTLECFENACI